MAAVKFTYAFRIKPGRFGDWHALTEEADKLVQHHHGGTMRYFVSAIAGPEPSTTYGSLDFPSAESLGEFLDAVQRDPESQAFSDRIVGRADSPAEGLTADVLTEIPLGLDPGAEGPVMDSYAATVVPGRLDEAVALGVELAPLSLRHGATRVGLYVAGPAGSASGLFNYLVEYPSFKACGRNMDALGSDPDLIAAGRRVAAADSPLRIVHHALYAELPR